MYNDTVTVFNRRGDFWYPTVLRGVHLVIGRNTTAARYGWDSDIQAALLVPVDGDGLVGGKEYVPPKAWREVPDPESFVTFQTGEEHDFFIMGRWEILCPVDEGEYPGGFYQSLRRTRDGVFAIANLTRYRVIPHFEIVGR